VAGDRRICILSPEVAASVIIEGAPKEANMGSETLHVLSAGRHIEAPRAVDRPADALWITRKELEHATGWNMKPEGLCHEGVCIPIAPVDRQRLVDEDRVCASGLWETLGRPVLQNEDHSVWMLGESAADRSRPLESLEAPDFTLPDITGKLHSLSDYRGKKVFLATWASW
jgi:hypothetical protein